MIESLIDRDEEFILEEENVQTFYFFVLLTTQWRVGFAGAIGMDYNVLFELFRLYDIKKKERVKIFEDVRIMESAALSKIREKK